MAELHREEHRGSSLGDLILGGQDGLVNVLGLVLGVAASSNAQNIILAAGFAAALAESVSMAAVMYTSSMARSDFYNSEMERERREIETVPEREKEETRAIFANFGLKGALLEKAVESLSQDKERWVQFMMSEELKLEPVDRSKVLKSSALVGIATVIGSIIPIVPFLITADVRLGIIASVIISSVALFGIGAYKAKTTVGIWYRSGLQMFIIGIVAALIGYGVGLLFGTGPIA